MPEITQHNGLKKPLASETADISVINDNMDVIDSALGDLSAVPTAAKDTAGAITELFEALENADIPDATLTTKGKVQLSSATNSAVEDRAATPRAVKDAMEAATGASGSLSAHATATNVHGATSTAMASRLIIRDADGRAKVASPAASDDIARLAEVDTRLPKTGGNLGPTTMTGKLALKPDTGVALGNGGQLVDQSSRTVLLANQDAFEVISENGTNYIFQASGSGSYALYRGRQIWDTGFLRVNAGQLEFYDGGSWKGGGAELSTYPNQFTKTLKNTASIPETLTTMVNVTGKRGYLDRALFGHQNSSNGNQIVITIDGVVVFNCLFSSNTSGTLLGGLICGGQSAFRYPSHWAIGAADTTSMRDYPYVQSGNQLDMCITPSKIFFENSLKIEAKTGAKTGTSVVTWHYEIGYATN